MSTSGKGRERIMRNQSLPVWDRVKTLVTMKDKMFVRRTFPCTRQIGSASGLTVNHVQEWFASYLELRRSPLACTGIGACLNYKVTPHYGPVGCWCVTLMRRDGSPISVTTGAVRKLAKDFRAVPIRGHREGTVLLRIECSHQHTIIKKKYT